MSRKLALRHGGTGDQADGAERNQVAIQLAARGAGIEPRIRTDAVDGGQCRHDGHTRHESGGPAHSVTNCEQQNRDE